MTRRSPLPNFCVTGVCLADIKYVWLPRTHVGVDLMMLWIKKLLAGSQCLSYYLSNASKMYTRPLDSSKTNVKLDSIWQGFTFFFFLFEVQFCENKLVALGCLADGSEWGWKKKNMITIQTFLLHWTLFPPLDPEGQIVIIFQSVQRLCLKEICWICLAANKLPLFLPTRLRSLITALSDAHSTLWK